MTPGAALAGAALAWWGYAYVGYPAALALLAAVSRKRLRRVAVIEPREWPEISICLVAHNAGPTIGATLTRLLAVDYPADRRQILVASDASTDDTDAIVASFAPQGVELLRLSQRGGKTVAENAAAAHARGEIIVNTDVTVIVDRFAIKPLVAALDDAGVGVASGRDVSISAPSDAAQRDRRDESAYVGYEMFVRDLETRVTGIVGASGCLYAARRAVQRTELPGGVSRDFAAPLIARRLGLRSVSVRDAICYVPGNTGLAREWLRKRRTVTRGLATLVRFREQLSVKRDPVFAWALISHKVVRWLAPWWALAGLAGLLMLFPVATVAVLLVAGSVTWLATVLRAGGVTRRFAEAVSGAVAANAAVIGAWIALARGINPPVWEPTRRSSDLLAR